MRAEKVVEVLRQAEWADKGACPLCYSLPGEGHDEDCKLAALLDEGEKEGPSREKEMENMEEKLQEVLGELRRKLAELRGGRG